MGLLTKLLGKKPVSKTGDTKLCELYERHESKLAGVTFKNDDGTERQEILKKIYLKQPPFDDRLDIAINEYDFDGRPALAVSVNGNCVGNIKKERVKWFKENGHLTKKMDFKVYGGQEGKNYGARLILYFERKDK